MYIKKCNNSNIKSCKVDELPNIPLLPWGHRICNKDISNCDNFPIRPGSRFKITKWKTGVPLTAVIPTNSRPLPQPNKWCAPGRPLPSLDNLDELQNIIDFDTGNFIQDIKENKINHSDYLLYNNKNYYVDNNGNIVWCDDKVKPEDKLRANFYSGPGWKRDRVHATRLKPLSRPIKHWRKQLFPRQFINDDGNPSFDINSIIDENTSRRGRRGTGTSVFETPNGYFKTDPNFLNSSSEDKYINNNNVSCIPIYVKDISFNFQEQYKNLNETVKKELIECFRNNAKLICKNALLRARPGNNQSSSSYQFQSNRGYLQARVKLHRQSSTFSYNPYMIPKPIDINSINDNSLHKFPPNTISLYISHRLLFFDPSQKGYTNSCYGSEQLCNCGVPVTYKPRNISFQCDSAVTSRNNTRKKSRIAINRNQYNITNFWGITAAHDTLYNKCINPWRINNIRRKKTLLCDNIKKILEKLENNNNTVSPETDNSIKNDLASLFDNLQVLVDLNEFLSHLDTITSS